MTAHPPEPTSGDLASYADLAAVLSILPLLLREARRTRRLSVRAAGAQIGCAPATVSRLERGDDCSLANAIAVLRWLDTPPAAGTAGGTLAAVTGD